MERKSNSSEGSVSRVPEPVLSRATIAAVLQLAGLAGMMSQADFALLVEVLVAVLPPLITLIGGYLARKKVTPV